MSEPLHRDDWGEVHIGDCVDVLPRLGIAPQLILTSPPYGGLRTYGGHDFDFAAVAGALVDCMPPGGVMVWIVADETIDGSETGDSFRQALHFLDLGLRLHDTMILHRTSGPSSRAEGRYRQAFHYMFVFSRGRPGAINLIADRKCQSAGTLKRRYVRERNGKADPRRAYTVPDFAVRDNIWPTDVGLYKSHPGEIGAYRHPAILALRIAQGHIRTWTNPGDLVLDPMAGSGTTLRAAKGLGRRYAGIEIHAPYGAIIQDRLAQEVLLPA